MPEPRFAPTLPTTELEAAFIEAQLSHPSQAFDILRTEAALEISAKPDTLTFEIGCGGNKDAYHLTQMCMRGGLIRVPNGWAVSIKI